MREEGRSREVGKYEGEGKREGGRILKGREIEQEGGRKQIQGRMNGRTKVR